MLGALSLREIVDCSLMFDILPIWTQDTMTAALSASLVSISNQPLTGRAIEGCLDTLVIDFSCGLFVVIPYTQCTSIIFAPRHVYNNRLLFRYGRLQSLPHSDIPLLLNVSFVYL